MWCVPFTPDAVTLHGRIVPENGGIWLGWTNTGFSFRFEGRHITFRFAPPAGGQVPYVGILVDKEPRRMLPVDPEHPVLEISLPTSGEHTVRLLKMTELLDDISLFVEGVYLEDGARLLPPPPLSSRRLEFIGDSITCGYGNLCAGPMEPFSPETEDSTQTYAALTARHFGADARYLCRSGRGIVTDCDGCRAQPAARWFFETSLTHPTPWDFTSWQPDVLVVNMGTNDHNGGLSSEEFIPAAQNFLRRIRGVYPKARLLWMYGLMDDEYIPAIKEIVESIRAEDPLLDLLLVPSVNPYPEEHGSCYHPNLLGHARAARALIPKIAEMTGWEACPSFWP